MKYYLILFLFFLSIPLKGQNKNCKEEIIKNSETNFPKNKILDYEVLDFQVKVGFPLDIKYNRIWVKGSKESNFVQIFSPDDGELSEIKQLHPPFYTDIIKINSAFSEVQVKFSNKNTELKKAVKKTIVYPKGIDYMEMQENKFSMLFYGCFQPFTISKNPKGDMYSELFQDDNNFNYLMRKTLNAISEEQVFNFNTYSNGKVKNFTEVLLKNPKVLIGTGDQIYTDAGYNEKEYKNHPLSAWAHKCMDPYPLLDIVEYTNHLNRCYTHFNSFTCFKNIYSKLPSVNIWDDHEIRDGWGSHGDEYTEQGKLSDSLKQYYSSSRSAFIEHQLNSGPNELNNKSIDTNSSLEQKFTINGIQVFAFDLRSNRNSNNNIVISKSQLKNFKDWCNQIKKDDEVVILSSIPMFYESNKVAIALGKKIKDGELKDDIIDSWASENNKKQRNEIIKELIKLRNRNIKPIIVSGDVHIGGMISIWYKDEKSNVNKKLCYEFIFSGLSHESLGKARKQNISSTIQHRSEKNRVSDTSFSIDEFTIYPVYEFTRGRLNFGGLEFSLNQKTNTKASLFIIGDRGKNIIERELELDWDIEFDNYWKKAKDNTPFHWKILPWKWGAVLLPDVDYNAISIKDLDNVDY